MTALRRLVFFFFLALFALPAAAQQEIAVRMEALQPTRAVSMPADPIERLVEQYERTGRAEVLRQSHSVVYPYGHAQPILKCAPMRVCMVKLQPGEIVYSITPGDPTRWSFAEAYSGPNGSTTSVMVRPRGDASVTTNLIISTDRRTYHMTLDSAPGTVEGTNPQGDYMREVSFYYPDEMVQRMNSREEATRRHEARRQDQVTLAAGVSLTDLNHDYDWSRSDGFPWSPAAVFDDGIHTYIKPPSSAEHMEAALLFEITSTGEKRQINYIIKGGQYITDRVVEKAALVLGVDKRSGFLGLGGKKRSSVMLQIINKAR